MPFRVHIIIGFATVVALYQYEASYPLAIKHGVLENPRTEWRFIARKITDQWSIFQHAMFDYRRV